MRSRDVASTRTTPEMSGIRQWLPSPRDKRDVLDPHAQAERTSAPRMPAATRRYFSCCNQATTALSSVSRLSDHE